MSHNQGTLRPSGVWDRLGFILLTGRTREAPSYCPSVIQRKQDFPFCVENRAEHFHFCAKQQSGDKNHKILVAPGCVYSCCVRHQWEQETHAPLKGQSPHFSIQFLCPSHPSEIPAGSGPFNISNNAWDGWTGALRSFAGVGMLITGQGHRDPGELERRADLSLPQSSSDKCHVQHLRQKSSRFNIIWGGGGQWDFERLCRKIPEVVSFFIAISKSSYAVGMFWGRITNKILGELCLILLRLVYVIPKAAVKFARLSVAWPTCL